MTPPAPQQHPHPQKHRRGLLRLAYATLYSIDGLKAAIKESSAFRMELGLCLPGLPMAFWLGRNWLEVMALCSVLVLLLIVELLNSGIEAAIDRIGYDIHPFSKMAKDFGSAAVFLSSLLCGSVWLTMLWLHFAG